VACGHEIELKNLLSIKRAFMPFFFKMMIQSNKEMTMLVDTLREGGIAWKLV